MNDYIESYIKSCTRTEKQIANILFQLSGCPYIKIQNVTLAQLSNTSPRSITRAIKKFLEDGILKRHMQNGKRKNGQYIIVTDKNHIN